MLRFYNCKHSTEAWKECCELSLCHIDVKVAFSTDSSFFFFFPFSRSLSVRIVFSFVCGLHVFWLRSSSETGAGCNNCMWPPSQTEHLIHLPQPPAPRNRTLLNSQALWECRISLLCLLSGFANVNKNKPVHSINSTYASSHDPG